MKGKVESDVDVLGKEECELLSLKQSSHINNSRVNDSILITIFWDRLSSFISGHQKPHAGT